MFRIKTITLIGVMTAVICIVAPFSIPLPFSPVPISLTNLAVYITIYILGTGKSVISYILYLFIGAVGLPVYSGFSGGVGKLIGPTGGYLIGIAFMAVICGLWIDKWFQNRFLCLTGLFLGTVICYLFGTIWLAYQSNLSLSAALLAGVVPFIPGDLVKIIIATILGPILRRALSRAHLLDIN